MSAKSKPRKAPKPTVLCDLFGFLDEKPKNLLLLSMNMEADAGEHNSPLEEIIESGLDVRAANTCLGGLSLLDDLIVKKTIGMTPPVTRLVWVRPAGMP